MVISAMYPKKAVDIIADAIDAAIDFDAVREEDVELLRNFITSLNNLKSPDGVVICKPGEYARLTVRLWG